MKRRHFVATLGALTAGGAAAVGTGAFSSARAARNVDVTVAGDAKAFLSIEPGPQNGEYTTGSSDGPLALDFTDSNTNVGGDGVNANALSSFLGVFQVQNSGTQPVELDVDPLIFVDIDGSAGEVLAVFLVPSPPFSPLTLGVGDAQAFSVIAVALDFGGGATGVEIDSELEIEANAT